jgi:predicted CXXCH cytochrome family protein
MRKIMIVLALLAAVGLLAVGQTGFAAVSGTAHSSAYTTATAGDCSVCHVPHAAQGRRLWPSAPSTLAETTFGNIGALCYYCHSSGGGKYLAAANADNTAFHASAHGVGTTSNPDGGTATSGSGLPYATATSIECTSCHNPHEDGNRPFLVTAVAATNISNLCAKCHPSRLNSGNDGSGTWSGYGSGNAAGSHPAGSNVYTDTDGAGNSPINATALGIRGSGVVADYRLGPKIVGFGASLASGNGMTCNSCHSVHGVESADGGVTVASTPNEDLLAVAGTGTMSGHANGGQSASTLNPLCEACHVGADSGANATYDPGTAATYAGTYKPNPGGTIYTHPVDDLGAFASVGVGTNFPKAGDNQANLWPRRSGVGGNVGDAPVCESCHMPHPNASAVAQTSAPATVATGTHILRDAEAPLCSRCHGTVPGHHPAGVAMGRFADTNIVPSGTTLECGHCHSGNGAHNWSAARQVGLNANWEPANNARPHSAGQTNANMSKECVDCHLPATITAAYASPTQNAGASGDTVVSTKAYRLQSEYTDSGEGTHYLGTTTIAYDCGVVGTGTTASAFNPTTTAWTAASTGTGKGAISLWGSAAGTMVCESCHTLNPAWAADNTSLLPVYYQEGAQVASEAYRNQFCTGCHGATPGGGTPHPMSQSTITKAQEIGRATTTLITTTGSYADKGIGQTLPGAWAGNSTYPAADRMNCDSCHQPHDAPTNAGTWIVDTLRASITAGVTLGNASPGKTATPAAYQTFCLECHTY